MSAIPMETDNRAILLNFQRSGSNFLQSYILQKTDVLFDSVHHFDNLEDYPIITIVRSPEDCFRSALSMHRFYNDNEPPIKALVNDYIALHNFAISKKATFINFNDLIESPEKVLEIIAKKFNLPVSSKEYKNNLIDKTDLKHLSSSALVPGYNEITFLEEDIKYCKDLYQDLLLKCISL